MSAPLPRRPSQRPPMPASARPARAPATDRLGPHRGYALLLVLAAVYLGPMLMLVNTALKTQPSSPRTRSGRRRTFTIENFAEAWDKADFPRYLGNTVLYAVVATLLYLASALPLSVAIARRYVRGWNLLYILFVIALFLPVALDPAVPAAPEPAPLQHPGRATSCCS